MTTSEQARAYLERDKLRYLDMLEILRRGSGDALHAWEDGVLLHDTGSGAWFTAADSVPTLERMLALLPPGVDLFVGHELAHRDRAAAELGLAGGHLCSQAAWLNEAPPELPDGAPPLVRLGQAWAERLDACYSHSFGGVAYMRAVVERGVLGAFIDGELAGFIGTHDEGTIGLLEVLPKFRRRGLGEILTLGAVRLALSEGRYAFGHIIDGNAASLALQHKAGMAVCETPMYWLF